MAVWMVQVPWRMHKPRGPATMLLDKSIVWRQKDQNKCSSDRKELERLAKATS